MDLTTEQKKMGSVELEAEFIKNPTGSIIEQKARRRAVKAKLRAEQQVIADGVVNFDIFPKAVAEYGEDGFGSFVKVYYGGKREVTE